MIGLLTLVLMQGWQPCAPMPTPGYGFACAEVGSRIYAIGGVVSEVYPAVPRLAVEAYDAAADSWIVGFAPLPKPKWYTGCAALDGKIYVIGGWNGQSDLSRVDRFDPSTNTWDTVAPLPWPRWSLAGCAYRGNIYAIGGFSTALGYQRAVARFTSDSGVGHWDVVESLKTYRTNPAAAVAGGEMCAVGGLFFNALPTWERYQADSWVQSYRLMHFARNGAAAVGWGQWLCAIGGQSLHGPMNSVEMVNVDSGFWLNAAYLSVPRVFCGAAVADGFVVVIGGRNAYGVEGSVEKSDSTLFPSGIEESQSQMQVRTAPRWTTVFSGCVRIACRSAAIYDGSGRRVFAAAGPVDAALAPGVYFARVNAADGRLVTGRIIVVR